MTGELADAIAILDGASAEAARLRGLLDEATEQWAIHEATVRQMAPSTVPDPDSRIAEIRREAGL